MKSNRKDRLPERVPFTAIPTGETRNLFVEAGQHHFGTGPTDISSWAHRTVWTDRMLETLINNRVKGGKWHALIDKEYDERNLFDAAHKVLKKKGAAGVDRQDAYCGFTSKELLISGLFIPREEHLSSKQEPRETEGANS